MPRLGLIIPPELVRINIPSILNTAPRILIGKLKSGSLLITNVIILGACILVNASIFSLYNIAIIYVYNHFIFTALPIHNKILPILRISTNLPFFNHSAYSLACVNVDGKRVNIKYEPLDPLPIRICSSIYGVSSITDDSGPILNEK